MDNASVLVIMGELAQLKEVHKIVPPNFDKATKWLKEKKEVLNGSPGRASNAKTLCGLVKDPERKLETTSDGGGLVVLCQAPGLQCTRNEKKSPNSLE